MGFLENLATGAYSTVTGAADWLTRNIPQPIVRNTGIYYVDPVARAQAQAAQAELQRQQQIAAAQQTMQTFYPKTKTPSVTTTNGATTTTTTQPTITSQGAITLGQEIPNVQPFTFDWVGETQRAYNALADFYNKLLDFAGGRVDLAKRVLEYTYQQGMRESTQQFEQETGELARTVPVETANLIASLNRRGVLESGFGKQDVGRLGESQEARRLAVQRARESRESRLTSQRGFGIEEAQRGLDEEKFNLERQRRKEAEQGAQSQRSIKGDIYEAELTKQQQEEARRAQNIGTSFMGQIAGGSTTTTTGGGSRPAGYGAGDTEFRRFMQSTGKQGELDKATYGSTQQGAEYNALKRKYGF